MTEIFYDKGPEYGRDGGPLNGDERKLNKMVSYNRGDVREGKKAYMKVRDWVIPFPRRPRNGYKTDSM